MSTLTWVSLELDIQTLEESEEDEQGGEEDEEDEEEEEIDEDHWVVEKVQEMRYNGKLKRVEFLVLWQADKSTSWEPIENFHGGYENLEIQRFQTEHPKRFEDVTNKATVANKKGRPKKQQTWITKDIDDDIYEKPDESAQGEAKRLADPNRLQDPSEKFLKTYGVGIEGRVSRSKTRDIRRTIEMSSADSSPSVRNRSPVPVEKEKKQKKPRGGKKKEAEASTSVPQASSPDISSQEQPESSTSSSKKPSKKEKEPSDPMSTFVLDNWKKKKRDYKLNSSDSSDDDLEPAIVPLKKRALSSTRKPSTSSVANSQRREGGGQSPTLTPENANTIEKSKKVSLDNSKRREVQKQRKRPQKQDSSSEEDDEVEKIRDPKVRYADEPLIDIEKKFAEMGYTIKLSKEHPKAGMLKEIVERRETVRDPGLLNSLHDSIMFFEYTAVELRLIDQGPENSYNELATRPFPLHDLLASTYEVKRRDNTLPEDIENRRKKTTKMIRMMLPYLPHHILTVQDLNLNTLLHGAINSENFELVEFLIHMGAPLQIRNKHEMTAVESCVIMRRCDILDLVIKNGGTFHFVLQPPIGGVHENKEDYYLIKKHIKTMQDAQIKSDIIQTCERLHGQISLACKRVRDQLNIYRELDVGPIVCFPRGNMRSYGNRLTIQFLIPEQWQDLRADHEFMLVVMPMAYHHQHKIFYGSPTPPPMHLPVLCGVSCPSMTTERSIFYRATRALRQHFEKCKKAALKPGDPLAAYDPITSLHTLEERDEMVKARISEPISPMMCTVGLDIDPTAPCSFMTCQLIVYKTSEKKNPVTNNPCGGQNAVSRPSSKSPRPGGPSTSSHRHGSHANDPRSHNKPGTPR